MGAEVEIEQSKQTTGAVGQEQSTRSPVTLRDYKARMLRVLVHIQQHLDEPLSLEDLANVACFSPYHFHRIFRGMVGEPVKEHIRRLRLERAAWHLKQDKKQVVQIALDAGYETHEAFTRAFKTAFGITPVEYRSTRRYRNLFELPVSTPGSKSRVHYSDGKQPISFNVMKPQGRTEIEVKTLPATRVAFVRNVGPYSGCGMAWEKLCTFMGKEGFLGGNSKFIGMSHDDPEVTPPERIRYDACISVDDSFQPQGEIGVQTIPGGEYAFTTHFGPYENLNKTYARVMGQWAPRNGRELGDSSCLEFYLNDPATTRPEDLVTDVYVPLKPKYS